MPEQQGEEKLLDEQRPQWDSVDRHPEGDPSETIDWLLAGDPSIRWQTMRDLLAAPPDAVASERGQVTVSGWGKRLLDRQDPEGTWANGLYGPKWTSTTYTLLLLRRCGLDQRHPSALTGVQRLWDGARYFDGGFTVAASVDFPEACVVSMYIALACYFGYQDSRVDDAIAWLMDNQLDDGGWNCRNVRFGDSHSSFHTTISALEALAEVTARESASPDVSGAMAGGREFFLRHRLYKSHTGGSVVSPYMTQLSFPPRWHYDILRGLDHFASVTAPWDDRFRDALDALDERQRKDGRWPVQHKYSGKVWFDMERTGGPSRWNTLRALRVLRWHGNAETSDN